MLIESEASGALDTLDTLSLPILLLGGTASPSYLAAAVAHLQAGHPERERVTLRGLGHAGASNQTQGGRPDVVAAQIIDFAARHQLDDKA